MPAPKKVELPKRKNNQQCGFGWKSWLLGVAMGTGGCWLIMSGTLDIEEMVADTPLEDIPTIIEDSPREAPEEDILDSLPIEFYKLLPSREEQIPDHIISQQVRENSPQRPMDKAGKYRLQAGSFQKLQDADRRRASILILGLETNIEKVTHGGKTWHRVMLGPFETLSHLEVAKRRLKENNIDSITLKLK